MLPVQNLWVCVASEESSLANEVSYFSCPLPASCRPSAGTSDLRVRSHKIKGWSWSEERGGFFHRAFPPPKTFKCLSDLTRGERWNRPPVRNLSNPLQMIEKHTRLLICIFSLCYSNSKLVPFSFFLFVAPPADLCDVTCGQRRGGLPDRSLPGFQRVSRRARRSWSSNRRRGESAED